MKTKSRREKYFITIACLTLLSFRKQGRILADGGEGVGVFGYGGGTIY